MAKRENQNTSFDNIFGFGTSKPEETKPAIPEVKPQEQPQTLPEEQKGDAPVKEVKETKPAAQNANKRGRKAKSGATEQSEGKKAVTVYLNAENWAQFCMVAAFKKTSASAWLDELIVEELRKNKDLLDAVSKLK